MLNGGDPVPGIGIEIVSSWTYTVASRLFATACPRAPSRITKDI